MTLVALRGFQPAPVPTLSTVQPEPPELREADLARIQHALTAAHAPSTLRTYASSWSQFERWCGERGYIPLPAHPATLCAYLTEQAEAGKSLDSLNGACSAISRRHRDHGLPSPTAVEAVRRVRRGLRRLHPSNIRRPAHPLDLNDIQRILSAIDRTTPTGQRDAAVILLGFASALRVSELAALTLADLEYKPGGLLLHIRAAKTDPQRKGQVVAVTQGRHRETDPLSALDDWLTFRGATPGSLFTSMRGAYRSGRVRIEQVSPTLIGEIVQMRAKAAGLVAERITGHSLRAGHATTAAVAGVPIDQIAAQTRHREINVLIQHYIRPAQVLQRSSSQHLGL